MQEGKITEEYVEISDFEPEKDDGFQGKIAKFLKSSYFTAVCVVLVAISSFALGRISSIKEIREPIRIIQEKQENLEIIENKGEVKGASVSSVVPVSSGEVVGSKNGTKYHYPWCPGASQIAEKNKVTFASIEEARSKGYTPAANCKGLK
jgi:hypothetical protein